jgi:hypothetical protein
MSENNNVIDISKPEDTALAKHTQQADLMTRFQPQNFGDLRDFAEIVVQSKICGVTSAADALVMMMTGAELGMTVMQSIRGIHIVKGRPVLAADTMGAIVKRASVCEYLRVVEISESACVLETKRVGEPEPVKMAWTLEDAQRAGLTKDNWQRYPQAMLKARCMAQICRAVYPDVIAELYDPDEIESIEIRETPETRKGVVQASAADRLWSLVLEAVGKERALVWRGHYLAGVECEDLWDVPTKKLEKMHEVIRMAPDAAAYVETCIERAETKRATKETSVEDTGKQLAAKADAARAKRIEDKRPERIDEFNALLDEAVDEDTRDAFIALYVMRMAEANNNSVEIHTLADIDVSKIGSLCRKLRGMDVAKRKDYIDGVIADATGEIDKAEEAESNAALEEQDKERYQAIDREWFGAAREPFVQNLHGLTEKQQKKKRQEAKLIVDKFRAICLHNWNVESSRELAPEEYQQRASVLSGFEDLEERKSYILNLIESHEAKHGAD